MTVTETKTNRLKALPVHVVDASGLTEGMTNSHATDTPETLTLEENVDNSTATITNTKPK